MKIVRLLFFIFLTGFCVISESLAAAVPAYHITAAIDTRHKKITARETVTFTNTSHNAVHEIFFHIYPNREFTKKEKAFMVRYAGYFKINPFPDGFQTGRIVIRSVREEQSFLAYQIEEKDQTFLKVLLPGSLEPGAAIELTLDFTVDIPHAYGRFGWHDNIFALARWYPILSVLTEDGWQNPPFYPFHRPFYSEAANYKVELTVPLSQKVIHSAELKKEAFMEGEMRTLTLETSFPVREFALAMSPDYQWKEKTFNGVKIKSFYLPGDELRAAWALADAEDLMRYYTKLFGPYPYSEFSIAPVHLGYGGEQMPNMIFIDTRVYRLPQFLRRYFDFLVSHETGHQWFYNIVGMDEFTQIWLEEGINSYFNLEYLENKYGKDAAVIDIPPALSWLIPNFSFRGARDTRYKTIAGTNLSRPVEGKLSSFQEPSSIFSLTYGKGAGVIAMTRYLLGDDAFKRVFERIFREYQFKNFTRRDLLRLCKEESGNDLSWFFTQWLDTTKVCDYALKKVRGNNITIENRGEILMPLELRVIFKDGSEKLLKVAEPVERERTVTLPESLPIKRVILDPRAQLLDIDRTNNSWPRKVYIKPVPLYLGIYEIPVFLPDDSYNVVVGPEAANSGIGLKVSAQKPYQGSVYAATDYVLGEKLQKSRVGYQIKNLFHEQTTAGVELFNDTDYDNGEEDLAGGKVYFRRELWPAPYGLGDINSHTTLYLIRDRSLGGDLTTTGREDSRNISYLKKDEAIAGVNLHLDQSGPYPDPQQGYKLDSFFESSGHFLGATQYFYRSAIDGSVYQSVTPKSKLALRLKYGWGFPDDKNLYELGGIDGLRGFDRKTVRGSSVFLSSIEYRFPIVQKMDVRLWDNIAGLESVGGVVFFDVGESWYDDPTEGSFKKDAGLGLRLTVNVGSFLEKALLRVDVAQPINESKKDPHVWFGVNQAF